MDPTNILAAIHITGRGDSALDPDAPGLSLAVTEHARDRSPASVEALRACVRDGARLHEFHLTPLPPAAMYVLSAVENSVQRAVDAFCASCFAVTDAAGVRHEAQFAGGAHGGKRQSGTYARAAFAWYERWAEACGFDAPVEMGAVALKRAEVSPRDVGFYWPLAGVRRLMR